MASLFEHVKNNYNTYPSILGYYYLQNLPENLNEYDYLFVSSDYSIPAPTSACQMMTSAEDRHTFMWLQQDFSSFQPFPASEYTDVPTVGFVGRIPIFTLPDGSRQLHRGFEPRYSAWEALEKSNNICFDAHPRFEPLGDSAGFWNDSIPDKKKWEPMFKINMLANQYNLCARGNANWSLRFFETLAYGRIPVYIESGGRLPWDQVNNYFDDTFVYVTDIKNIESDILNFHETHTLHNTQKKCREMYDTYFSQEGQIRLFDEFPPGN